MTEETQVATAPATQNSAPVSTAQADLVESQASPDAAQEGESEKPEKTAEQKELEYLRRKATKADRNNARLYQEAQHLREQLQRTAPSESQAPQNADPHQMAREIAAVERISEKSNDVAKDGQARFPDFAKALDTVIAEAGPLIDKRGFPTALGEAILDAEKPADLIHFLGSNPALADELEGLSPTQLGRRIDRLEAQMKAKPVKPASSAPAPIKPLAGSTSAVVKNLEKSSMAEYKAERAKQGARWAR